MAGDDKNTTRRRSGEPLGRYLLQRELGRGGMAVVYEAVDTQLGRRVAVKVLHARPGATDDENRTDEERFLREARLAGALPKHPNLVAVHDAGADGGRRYLVMELIQGRGFTEWRLDGPPPLKEQIRVLRDVALAVHHAHEHGVVHRDLKPANLLVDAEGRVHVTDFGLAKLDASAGLSITADGVAVGTPGYMSPEQAQGLKTVDRRADVYSLGVLLYEILTGRTPFQGESVIAVLTQVIRDPVKPPSVILKGRPLAFLDPVLERICLKAVAKDPVNRYPSAERMAADLETWISGGKVRVDLPPGAGLPRRMPWLAPAAVSLALLGALLFWRQPPPPPPPADIEVLSTSAWTDTGVDLAEGESVIAEAEGSWSNHDGSQPRVGAAGREALFGTKYEGMTRKWPVPEGPLMALVARVGEQGRPWVLPPGVPVRAPGPGRLHLGPNDDPANNGGSLRVRIRRRVAAPEDSRVNVHVPASQAWSDSGVDLRPGDRVTVVASGTWNRNSQLPRVSALGQGPPAGSGFPAPGASRMALVARVGPVAAAWRVVPNQPVPVEAPGRLFLGPNDTNLGNNGGELWVSVYVRRETPGERR